MGLSEYDMPAAPHAEDWNSFSVGFYEERHDVVRGVSLAPPSDLGAYGFSDCEGSDVCQGCCFEASASAPCHEPSDYPRAVSSHKFPHDCLAPRLPFDPFFTLSPTTIHVACAVPSAIGNDLIHFFCEMTTTSFLKVKHSKLSLKAQVVQDNVPCTVKVRTFQTEQGIAVEFRPQSGNVLSFGNCYQSAANFLQVRFPGEIVSPDPALTLLTASMHRVPPLAPALDSSDLSPMLDMASNCSSPGLQAEAACALAAIAENGGRIVSGLFSKSAFERFQVLLNTDCFDVQYPTARMLVSLAAIPEAARMFASQGLLAIILGKMDSMAPELMLQQQMAQALCTAILHSVAVLSEQLSKDLASGLADVLRAQEAEKSGKVYETLFKAYSALIPRALASTPG